MNLSLIFIATIVIGVHGQARRSKHLPLKNRISSLRSHQPLEPHYDVLNSQFRGNKARIHELLLELINLYEEELFANANPVNWDPSNERMLPFYDNPPINEKNPSKANQESEPPKIELSSPWKVTSDNPWALEDIPGATEESLGRSILYSLNEDLEEWSPSSFPLDTGTDIPDLENRIKQGSNLRNAGSAPVPQDYDSISQGSQSSENHFTMEATDGQASIEFFTHQNKGQSSSSTFLDHSTEGSLDESEEASAMIPFNYQMSSVEPILDKPSTIEYPEIEPFKDLVMNSTDATQSQEISTSTNSSHPVKFMMHMMKDYHKEMLHELVKSCDNSTGPCPILPTNQTETPIETKAILISTTAGTNLARKVDEYSNHDQMSGVPSHVDGNEDAEIAYVDPEYPSAPDVPVGQRVQEDEYGEKTRPMKYKSFPRFANLPSRWRNYRNKLRLFSQSRFQKHL